MQVPITRLLWLVLSLVASPLCTTGAEVSGFLRDNQGNGLVGISVKANVFSISNVFTQPVTTTDASGHFRFVDNAGWWTVGVPASELNGRGYFSVADANLTLTNQAELRFTTRKPRFERLKPPLQTIHSRLQEFVRQAGNAP